MRFDHTAHDHAVSLFDLDLDRAAPGRRTLTQGLAPRLSAALAPAAGEPAPHPDGGALPGLLDAAARPDLGDGTIWRKATVEVAAPEASASPDAAFARATSGTGGEVPYRAQLEQSFGQDFGAVRAFLGCSDALDDLGAHAAARGDQVAFGTTAPSLELVAHEMAHVAQARAHGGGAVHAKDAVSSPDHAAEREADAVAAQVVRGERVRVSAAPRAGISLSGQCKVSVGTERIRIGPGEYLKDKTVVVVEEDQERLHQLREVNPETKVTVRFVGGSGSFEVPVRCLDLGTYKKTAQFGSGRSFQQTRGLVRQDDPESEQRRLRFLGEEQRRREERALVHQEGGTGNANFSRPIAIAGDESFITIETWVHTKNCFDRIAWALKLVAPSGKELWPKQSSHDWNNPAWPEELRSIYRISGSTMPGKDGPGDVGVRRRLRFQVPTAQFREFFGQHGGARESSMITVGMKLFYGGDGPTTATKQEQSDLYAGSPLDHNWGFLRGDPDEGRVDLSSVATGLRLEAGEWLDDNEVWNLPLRANPSPNKLKGFPVDYAQRNEHFAPLVPTKHRGEHGALTQVAPGGRDSTLNLATRVENEATLKVSSGEVLGGLIHTLDGLVGKPQFNELMQKGGELMRLFVWSLHLEGPKENPALPTVFTDVYMDDPERRALRAGVGIRKRMSDTATKLNVKTGEGYNVGKLIGQDELRDDVPEHKSDIYRRHEIGFDLNPSATAQQIGAFLGSGLDGEGKAVDHWNKGGEQANLTTVGHHGERIDFAKLRAQMVLRGTRRKFKVQAVRIGTNTPINIEISCDQTRGRRFEGLDESMSPAQMFEDTTAHYQDIFNVEMELEHLGAGGAPPTTQTFDGPSSSHGSSKPSSSTDKLEEESSEVPLGGAIRPTHPGRMYLRKDTSAPEFNTPSFQVFYEAHDHLIALLRAQVGDKELGKAPQKLDDMHALLFG